jgi:RNA polymerase sigma factor (sigma-70 family)
MTTQTPFHIFARKMGHPSADVDSKTPILTAEQEIELVAQMQGTQGENAKQRAAARETLILAYRPLARRMAHNAAVRGVVSRDDLQGEAMLALTKAIDNFDPNRGARISTPAQYEIKSALMRYVMDNSGPTRVGTNLDDKRIYMRLRTKVRDLESRENRTIRDSDIETIATELGVKISAVKRMMPRVFASDTSVSSTDASVEDDNGLPNGGGGLSYIAVSGGQEERDVAMDVSRLMRVMEDVVTARWTDRNREIIMAFVRGPCSKAKLDKLAAKYAISVERVRQIQREGREALRVHLQTVEGIRSVDDISL